MGEKWGLSCTLQLYQLHISFFAAVICGMENTLCNKSTFFIGLIMHSTVANVLWVVGGFFLCSDLFTYILYGV